MTRFLGEREETTRHNLLSPVMPGPGPAKADNALPGQPDLVP